MKPYYQDSHCTIYHGDCREILPELPKVDLVLNNSLTNREFINSSQKRDSYRQPPREFADSLQSMPYESSQNIVVEKEKIICITDPPYGVNFRSEKWDKEIPEIATQLPELFKNCAIITAPTTMWDYSRPNCVLCWYRPASSSRTKNGGFNHWSPILIYGNEWPNPDSINLHAIQNSYGKEGIGHPSPKPIKLMKWLIESMDDTATILDPFMGSGTTLRAAKDLNRKAIGIELEEKYCEIAVKRLAQEVLQF